MNVSTPASDSALRTSIETEKVAAGRLAARIDRLPATRSIWLIVVMPSLGFFFELYDLLYTGYIAPGHVDIQTLSRSSTTTYCPYMGDASYYGIAVGDARSPDAVWTYETPFDAVAAIEGYLAFYPDRVDAIELREAAA